MKATFFRTLPLGAVAAVVCSAVFAAPAFAAEAWTDPASEVSATEATLNGHVAPYGKEILYGFEYGTTTAYGSGTPGQVITEPPEWSGVPVSYHVKGLKRNTTYHYRLVAYGGGTGTIYGKDQTFKTSSGLYMMGEESVSEALQPKLAATSYPRVISGVQYTNQFTLIKAGGIPVTCEGTSFLGSTINEAVNSFELYPVREGEVMTGECEFFEEPATVTLNGCYFSYEVANAGPPYTGSEAIDCKVGSPGIEVSAAACSIAIPPQAIAGSVSYDEVAAEGGSGVRIDSSGTNVEVEKLGGPLCFLVGATGSTDMAVKVY